MQILVLGMHRSGTSMVARLLNMMGAYFAPEGVEMPAHRANPKGFWERNDVYELCKKILAAAGCDWQRVANFDIDKLSPVVLAEFNRDAGRIILAMDAHRPWFLKEPRLCLLAPLWLQLLEFPVCVLVHRSPLEVASSLQTRNEFPLSFGLALWERYNVEVLNATCGQRRIQVNHADLMADPVGTVRQLQQKLEEMNVVGLRAPSEEEIHAFIDPTLYRAKRESIGRRSPLSVSQRKLWKSFQSGKALRFSKPIRFSAEAQTLLQLVESKDEIEALEKRKIAVSSDLEKLKERLAQVEKRELERREKAEKEIAELARRVGQQAEAIERRNLWREKSENAMVGLRVKISLLSEAIERRNQWRGEAEKEASELKTTVSEQAGAIRDRDQWREKAEKEISELKITVSEQVEAIQGRDQWREKEVSELKTTVSEQAEAIEGRDQWRGEAEKEISKLAVEISQKSEIIGHRDLEIANLIERVRQGNVRILKLKEFLRQACSYIDRLLRSSRWKLGSLLTFRSKKPPGGKGKGWFMTEYKRWEKTRAVPPSAPVSPSMPLLVKALGPGTSPPFKPKSLEQGDAGATESAVPPSVSPQCARLRAFDVEAVDRITAKLAAPISIVVPIFNSASDLERCIESILRQTAPPFELILVDDCSPDPAISALLAKYEANDDVRILRQNENRGFVRSANVGMRASAHDVVLLNSDTEVTPRWRQKLTVAAYCDPQIA
ncbi:MAG: glycosyltransferase, partial [Chthoniobacterales bacterium]